MAQEPTPPPSAGGNEGVVSGRSARFAASLFHYGNIVAILIPFPLLIFWFGASMVIYAMNRHHPNPKVARYMQRGATRFYGVTGVFVVAATAFPVELTYYLVTWAIGLAILLPLSVWDLIRIRRDTWDDVPFTKGQEVHP